MNKRGDKNIAVIGRAGSWSTDVLSESLASKSLGGTILNLDDISYALDSKLALHPKFDLEIFDAFIIKKMGRNDSVHVGDQLSLLEMLEANGHLFLSKPSKLRRMLSRLSCTSVLQQHDLPMPPTFAGGNIEQALTWVGDNGPVVLKPLYSTKAKGMHVLHDVESARKHIVEQQSSGEKVIYLQKLLNLSGTDYAFTFLGGEFIGAYARVGDGSTWHTTTVEGRQYAEFKPDAKLIQLAKKAADLFELDLISVDIAISEEMGPVLFEVGAFGAFKGMKQGCGIDLADLVASYAYEKTLS